MAIAIGYRRSCGRFGESCLGNNFKSFKCVCVCVCSFFGQQREIQSKDQKERKREEMAEYIFRLGRWLSAQQQGQGVEVSLLACIKVKVTGGSGKGAALFGKSENQKRFFVLFRCNDRVCDETTCLLYFFSFCRKAKKNKTPKQLYAPEELRTDRCG